MQALLLQSFGRHVVTWLEFSVGQTALAARFPDLRLAVPIDEAPLPITKRTATDRVRDSCSRLRPEHLAESQAL